MELISFAFDTFLINPLTNFYILLTTLTGNAGVAVILLTIIIRVVTVPLTLKQMHATRMMAAIQPRMQEVQRRYSDPRRRSQEQMKLYREFGVNPMGCLGPMLLQMPILIALYRTFILAVGQAPEALIKVSDRIYPWGYLRSGLPLPGEFLWLHMGRADPIVLPVLVAATTFILQKITVLPAMDERQRAQNSMMNILMPFIFGWITISLPSGLGLYYVLSNLIGIVMQYAYVGGGPLNWRALVGLSQEAVLPRALEVREAQMEAARKVGRSDEEETREAAARSTGAGAGRRRRRYASGRRRGRR